LTKAYNLNVNFRTNLIQILTSNLKLNHLKKKKVAMPTDCYMAANDELPGTQYSRAKAKWERLTHFMLNIDNIQGFEEGDPNGLSPSLIKLLEESNFIMAVPDKMTNHGS
jgi:hypothetical protein